MINYPTNDLPDSNVERKILRMNIQYVVINIFPAPLFKFSPPPQHPDDTKQSPIEGCKFIQIPQDATLNLHA